MAAQNCRRSPRPATEGRPGDRNGVRPARSERRLWIFIPTPFSRVLRPPLEFALHAAIAVMDEPAARHGPAVMKRLLQGVENEAGVSRAADPPADNTASVGVDDEPT